MNRKFAALTITKDEVEQYCKPHRTLTNGDMIQIAAKVEEYIREYEWPSLLQDALLALGYTEDAT